MFDKLDVRKTRIIIGALVSSWKFLFYLVALRFISEWLLYLIVPILYTCGFGLVIINAQLSNLFPPVRSSIITLTSGMSEMSIMQTIIMSKLFDWGVRFSSIILVYFVLTIVLWLNTFLVMPKRRIVYQNETDNEDVQPESEEKLNSSPRICQGENENLSKSSLRQILKSPIFISNCIFFGMGALRVYWPVGLNSGRLLVACCKL
jgi:hypothetical protein